MTVTSIRTRVRTNRPEPTSTPESERITQLNDMLTDPRYAGYRDELQAARDELVALTARTALAA